MVWEVSSLTQAPFLNLSSLSQLKQLLQNYSICPKLNFYVTECMATMIGTDIPETEPRMSYAKTHQIITARIKEP